MLLSVSSPIYAARSPQKVSAFARPHTFFNGLNNNPPYYDKVTSVDPTMIDTTSIQGSGTNYNAWAIEWRATSAALGHPWVIFGDEQGPAVNQNLNNLAVLRRESLWGNLVGGGAGVEWYFGYQGSFGDVQSEDFRVVEPLWEQTAVAINFMNNVAFWDAEFDNSLVCWSSSTVRCLAEVGQFYIIQSPNNANNVEPRPSPRAPQRE